MPELDLDKLKFDPEKRLRERRPKAPPVELTEGIFRAYDIRGIVGKTLDEGIAYKVGQAVGSLAVEQEASPVVVARDGRHSGPGLLEGLVEGLRAAGSDVVDIGMAPTGVLYYAAHEAGAGSGVMVTGSHNPPEYNGIKMMVGGTTLSGDQIHGLYERLVDGDLRVGRGSVKKQDMLDRYLQRVTDDISLERPLRVVADCGNGVGGVNATSVLRAIGAEVLPLYDEVNGDFPNHHPDPSEPENLTDLIESVKLMNAELGVAFDGDADRLGVVTPSGEIIFPDRVMMLLARDVLSRNPGATIIYDVKCTGHLHRVIEEAGGKPVMYKTGHSLIKEHMKRLDSPFAGEMSGHFFFGERWYGVDDGIYGAARLLEILAKDERSPEEVLSSLPSSVSTPELKVKMEEGENHAFIEQFRQKAIFRGARVSKIDGLRADWPDGWGLVRASNTTPVLVLRFDADSKEALNRIQVAFREQLFKIDDTLNLPY
jgi:phosphomannomutase/phosphoglucomutase